MKVDPDGLIRGEWKPVTLPHAPVNAARAGPTVTASDPSPLSTEQRREADEAEALHVAERWLDFLDDDGEGGGVEDIARALAVLDLGIAERLDAAAATARARVAVHGRALARLRAGLDAEREEVVRLKSARRLDAERHRRVVESLTERLKRHESETAAKVDKIHDALMLAEAEAAEARSVDQLRTSLWMKRDRALVQQRLVARDLTKGSLQ
jgi:hypothetical protein